MTFSDYCRESGYRGTIDGLLARVEAPASLLDAISEQAAQAADGAAWRACQGGAGGTVITIGQVASAAKMTVREAARLAGITDYMGEAI